jgi:uncharacterized protein (TIGR00251 family)
LSGRVRPVTGGVRIAVRLTPKGGRDRIDGWAKDSDGKPYLKTRVASPPENGKANAALIALLAKTLRIAKSHIVIASGETARLKQVDVTGKPDYLRDELEALGEAP